MPDVSLIIKKSTLTGIANAVREQLGTSNLIPVPNLESAIRSIEGGDASPIRLNMTFKNNTPSIAYGEIVLSATDSQHSGNYDIMWGDALGVMSNYSKIDTLTLDVANNKTMASIELMKYNAIPKYATRVCAVQNGEIITSFNIPSAKLWSDAVWGIKKSGILVISDPHVQYETGHNDVQVALEYGNQRESVDATICAGDLTANGLQSELEEWLTDRDTWSPNTPVYSCNGNHESYRSDSYMVTNPSSMRKYLDSDWTNETESYFLKEIEGDIYIFLPIFEGVVQSAENTMFSTTVLDWLQEKLELYRNQRVFIISHVFPHWETTGVKYNGFASGNGAYSFDIWGNPVLSNKPKSDRTRFLNMLSHYKNTYWFSGHSHIRYYGQSTWKNLNIMDYNGARFIHVSSLTVPRDIIDGSVSDYKYAESEGALMDVYENCIRIRCRNFVGEKFYGYNEYIIDTTPVTIPPATKTLVSISATKTKTSYYTDESFNTSDISVTAVWSDNSTSDVTQDCVFDTSNVIISSVGTYTVGISYEYNGVTKTTDIQVTSSTRPQTKTLASIVASKSKVAYTLNESLSTSDITAVASYSDNTTADIANGDLVFDTSQVDMTTAGAYPIGVSYVEDGVTVSTTINITVSSVIEPTIFYDIVFSGTLAEAGAKITSAQVKNSHGGSRSYSGNTWGYASNTDAQGKQLYYKLKTDTGISNTDKIGFYCGTSSSNHAVNGQLSSYALDQTDWTPLVDNNNLPMTLTDTLIYFTARCAASSESGATFPVTVNARLQIGYMP